MFEVWNMVKVKNPDHARVGQAGVVYAVQPGNTTEVAVRFDVDLEVQLVAVADLDLLKGN
jgi:hypothetical protein